LELKVIGQDGHFMTSLWLKLPYSLFLCIVSHALTYVHNGSASKMMLFYL